MSHNNDETYLDIPKHSFIDERETYYTKKIRRLKVFCTVLVCLCLLLCGAIAGGIHYLRQRPVTASDKFERALGIMESEWFFADGIDNVEERLIDQALKGMTTNEEDLHTSYMTREEQESFVQGINRNFVGIGVQFFQITDGVPMIERVFRGAPAEEAGVLPGDIIYSVEGVLVEELSNDAIVDLVRGEAGTVVHMQFKRGDEIVSLNITRREISATVYGTVKDDVGVVEISQFGNTTAAEVQVLLEEYKEAGIDRLIIDLRGDGGGYVASLQQVAGLFLDSDAIALIEEDNKGARLVEKVKGTKCWNSEMPIVILVNGDTASAAEAFTLAMKEQRPEVTIVGTTTYGKGTAQITASLGDGSFIKYTYAKWLSPNGTWVNGTGITPDETVELPEVLETIVYEFTGEEDVYRYDSVGQAVRLAQLTLEYLGYPVDRTDGYFSAATENALRAFAQDEGLEYNGELNETLSNQLVQAVYFDWKTQGDRDTQMLRALEIVHE